MDSVSIPIIPPLTIHILPGMAEQSLTQDPWIIQLFYSPRTILAEFQNPRIPDFQDFIIPELSCPILVPLQRDVGVI